MVAIAVFSNVQEGWGERYVETTETTDKKKRHGLAVEVEEEMGLTWFQIAFQLDDVRRSRSCQDAVDLPLASVRGSSSLLVAVSRPVRGSVEDAILSQIE